MSLSLNEVWNELTKGLNENRNVWWDKIIERLNDSKRKYHNVEHIENKYKLYLDIKHLLDNKEAVEYALFFSYFEYEPQNIDTDQRNIEHFKLFCQDCDIAPDSILSEDVHKLLRCIASHITEEHKTKGAYGSEDTHYFLDLDMAVLGSDPEVYSDYAKRVKEEYDYLPIEVYKALRVKVLQTFLRIPNIFATRVFREKFEKQARNNIQGEINLLLEGITLT